MTAPSPDACSARARETLRHDAAGPRRNAAGPGAADPPPGPLRFDAALRAEQRRMAVLALMSCAWFLGAALIGTPEALAYLAPPLALIALLALGRYPGADALERRLVARRRSPAPRRATKRHRHRPQSKLLPRGGALLAAGLAGRAPPVLG